MENDVSSNDGTELTSISEAGAAATGMGSVSVGVPGVISGARGGSVSVGAPGVLSGARGAFSGM